MVRASTPGGRVPVSTDRVGESSEEPLTWTVTAEATVGAAAADIAAAAAATGRRVRVQLHPADTGHIRINFGANATATSEIVPAGAMREFSTEQRISAIRDTTDVRVSVSIGTVA